MKKQKLEGYITMLHGEDFVEAMSHYSGCGISDTVEEALKEWASHIELGLVGKRSKPRIFKVKVTPLTEQVPIKRISK